MEDKFVCKVTHSSLNEQGLRGKSRGECGFHAGFSIFLCGDTKVKEIVG